MGCPGSTCEVSVTCVPRNSCHPQDLMRLYLFLSFFLFSRTWEPPPQQHSIRSLYISFRCCCCFRHYRLACFLHRHHHVMIEINIYTYRPSVINRDKIKEERTSIDHSRLKKSSRNRHRSDDADFHGAIIDLLSCLKK